MLGPRLAASGPLQLQMNPTLIPPEAVPDVDEPEVEPLAPLLPHAVRSPTARPTAMKLAVAQADLRPSILPSGTPMFSSLSGGFESYSSVDGPSPSRAGAGIAEAMARAAEAPPRSASELRPRSAAFLPVQCCPTDWSVDYTSPSQGSSRPALPPEGNAARLSRPAMTAMASLAAACRLAGTGVGEGAVAGIRC
jgi:hypothetical protein